ncbi:MAG: hypothetical protein JRD89_21200 [Deltaproteobacteria bacterium]|nr:hypothetical protein [Deltaproteobacteria bacterium]
MDDDQFQALVLERLACIDTKISEIRERLARLETVHTLLKRGAVLVFAAILAKLGVDTTGLLG